MILRIDIDYNVEGVCLGLRARNQRSVNASRRNYVFFIRAESERVTTLESPRCWAPDSHVELGNGPIRLAKCRYRPCVLLGCID